MMQPCLICLHAISLVARTPPSTSGRERSTAFPCASAAVLPKADALCVRCCKHTIEPAYAANVNYPTAHGPNHLGMPLRAVLQHRAAAGARPAVHTGKDTLIRLCLRAHLLKRERFCPKLERFWMCRSSRSFRCTATTSGRPLCPKPARRWGTRSLSSLRRAHLPCTPGCPTWGRRSQVEKRSFRCLYLRRHLLNRARL